MHKTGYFTLSISHWPSVNISILAVPLMAVGFLLSNSKRNQRRNISELIVGFCLLFLGLSFMKESVPDLGETPAHSLQVTTNAVILSERQRVEGSLH